jgi:hypothetical protein
MSSNVSSKSSTNLAPETLQTVNSIMESVAMAKKKLDRDKAEIRALDDSWNRNAPEKRSE